MKKNWSFFNFKRFLCTCIFRQKWIPIQGHKCDALICSYVLNLMWIIIQFHFEMLFFIIICCKTMLQCSVRDEIFFILLICWLCKCSFLGYLDHDSVTKTNVAFFHIQILWSAKWKSCFQTIKVDHYIHQWDETLDFVINFVCIWRGF